MLRLRKLDKLKQLIFTLVFLFIFSFVFTPLAKAQEAEWVDQFGSIFTDHHDAVKGIAVSNLDEIYALTYTYNSSNGNSPVRSFVRKYESDGTLSWEGVSIFNQIAQGIAIDNSSNLYLVTSSSGHSDLFVKKLDSAGNELWTKFRTGGVFSKVIVKGQNLYVAGRMNGAGWTGKYDLSGNEVWEKPILERNSKSVGVDLAGNIYVTGDAYREGYWIGGYLIKYNTDGNELWKREYRATPLNSRVNDIAIDSFGNPVVVGDATGHFGQTDSFGLWRPYMRKYDASGNHMWTYYFDQSGISNGSGMNVASNNIGGLVIGGLLEWNRTDAFLAYFSPNLIPEANAGPDMIADFSNIVFFDGSTSTDKDGLDDIVSYKWDFGDGNIGSGITTSHIYHTSGNITAKLTVTDSWGQTNTDELVVTIENSPPIARSGSDQTANEAQVVMFDASLSTDPDGLADIISYDWNFGDGSTGIGITNYHIYDDNGIYTVSLTVTDSVGETSTDWMVVTVNNVAPTTTLSLDPITIIEGESSTLLLSNIFDVSSVDTFAGFTYSYDCTNDGVFEITNGMDSSYICSYPLAGFTTSLARIMDKDGGYSDYTSIVTVQTPAQAVRGLIDLVESYNLQQGINNSLDVKLNSAIQSLTDLNQNNDQAATNSLNAFINAVEAQRGNALTNQQADDLVAYAQRIINSLL